MSLVHIKVTARTKSGEFVAIVGRPKELGCWSHENALTLDESITDSANRLWTGRVLLEPSSCEDGKLEYRYFVYRNIYSHPNSKPRRLVVDWESTLCPRSRMLQSAPGEGQGTELIEDNYGESEDGQSIASKAWLCDSAICQVQLHLREQPLLTSAASADLLPSDAGGGLRWRVRCQPICIRTVAATVLDGLPCPVVCSTSNGVDCNSDAAEEHAVQYSACAWTTVTVLGSHTDKDDQTPSSSGTDFVPGSHLIFKTHAEDVFSTAFRLEFYLARDGENVDGTTFVCHTHVLPEHLTSKEGCGSVTCPIESGERLIGSLRVSYLVAKPCSISPCTMEVGCHSPQLWKLPSLDGGISCTNGSGGHDGSAVSSTTGFDFVASSTRLLHVGHRGCGSTPTKGLVSTGERHGLYENTLGSFAKAWEYGADFVEFDVLLTKEQLPIIFHDFSSPVHLQSSSTSDTAHEATSVAHTVAVNEISLEQLQLAARNNHPDVTGLAGKYTNDRLFPTLEQALVSLDARLGFFVEIKYPQMMKSGVFEEPRCLNILDRNKFVDAILAVLLKHAGDRRILVASFDADVCSLTRLKQNRFPVFFLSMGRTKHWGLYNDVRTHLVETAIHFAFSEGMQGVAVNAEDYLQDGSSLKKARDAGLAYWTWGYECNDASTFASLRGAGVDAIIYDRIGDFL